jgi:ABC-2 type transport system ATP-binding protein
MSTVIEAVGLSKHYGTVKALDGVSLKLNSGQVYLLVGPNGAGKTTLLRCLVGIARPTAGTITIRGQAFANLERPAAALGACLDPIKIPGLRSGRAHLRCLAEAASVDTAQVDQLIESVGLTTQAARRRAGGYSLGMRQRLTIAAALLGNPQIVVLDEPTTGLDVHGVAWLRHQIRNWAGEGRTVLVASHSLTELAAVVDMVIALDRGRLVRQVKRQELTANGEDLQAALFEMFAEVGGEGYGRIA